jgi:rhamnose transport system substrate-binding protein
MSAYVSTRLFGAAMAAAGLATFAAGGPIPSDWKAGVAKSAPNKTGQHIQVKDIPKLIGVEFYAATIRGMQQAARELGNVTVQTDAPTEARVEWQIEFINRFIDQKPDAITFAANDSTLIAPVLRKALDRGIHVIGYDADAQENAREFFVNQATSSDVAKALIEQLVSRTGPQADIAIVTSSFTSPNQTAWIAEMKKFVAASYPGLRIVAVLPSEEDQQLAFKATRDILTNYPSVKGILGISSIAFPGAAAAVKRAGQCGRVAVVGISTPNQMRSYIKEGCAFASVLWNLPDLGYATVYTARAVADGKLRPGDTALAAGRLGTLKVRGSEVLLGAPLIFTASNIDRYDF